MQHLKINFLGHHSWSYTTKLPSETLQREADFHGNLNINTSKQTHNKGNKTTSGSNKQINMSMNKVLCHTR